MRLISVSIGENETTVKCPFCGAVVNLADEPVVSCRHLDEDYLTPKGPYSKGYDVWFRG